MSDQSWQASNDEYLRLALAWLRLVLEQRAQPATVIAAPRPEEAEERGGRGFLRRPPPAPAPSQPLLPAPGGVSDAQIAEAAAAVREAESSDPAPALVLLSQQFELLPFERDILLLCAAQELDTRIASLCARVQADPNAPYPTFALALSMFANPAWEALSPERPLRFWRLIEIHQSATQPLTSSPLRIDERILNVLKGVNYVDDRLGPLLLPLAGGPEVAELPASQLAVATAITRHLSQTPTLQGLPIVQLLGTDAPSKALIAWQVADELGLHIYRLPAELVPTAASELEAFVRLWQRESLLLPLALYIDAHELDRANASDGAAAAIKRFAARSASVVFLDTREPWLDLGRATLMLDSARPTSAEQQAAWAAALGEQAADSPARLAGQFNLNLPAIDQIAQATLADAAAAEAALAERLWAASLRSTRPRLDGLAERLEAQATWDDLVLPEADTALLQEIAAQVEQRTTVYDDWGFRRKMTRGLGISVLFAGESGTGKTMAAEVLANDLRLNLYRIDLSAVVSKYIGETEKNLRRLFDAAEDGGTILFFDEADALFGKRSEVKDSHDRYANIEVNYLLQRMEAYHGLAILASNLKSALDPAFLRRLRFIVNFPFPGAAERELMWRKVFPQADSRRNLPGTPIEDLDYARLARLNLTGGSIHNIALNAAFLAAHAGSAVTMPLVMAAARTELRKLERPIKASDFS